MKKYIFSYLTLIFSIGILISENLIHYSDIIVYFRLAYFSLICYLIIKNRFLSSIILQVTILLTGIIYHSQYNYYQELTPNKIFNHKTCHLSIVKILTSRTDYRTYVTKETISNELILLKSTVKEEYYPGDLILTDGYIKPIINSSKKDSFDYQKYLARKKIHYQIISYNKERKIAEGRGLNNWIVKSKKKIITGLMNKYSPETVGIISAMFLGDKSQLDTEINKKYRDTGIAHILAISGLHVVMIFGIVQFFLTPLIYLKNGNIFRLIISLIFIWCFAFYVDLSPSVCRASLVITIYCLADLLQRSKNIFHILGLSAFVLLLTNPNYIFDIGFLLSFFAVFFIAWLNPVYKILYKPRNIFLRKVYDLITASVSAQLGTLPICLYFYGKTSLLSIFGNLIFIPASFFMLIGAIISVFFEVIEINFTLWIKSFDLFIQLLHQYIYYLSKLDFLIFEDLTVSLLDCVLIGILIYLIRFIVLYRSYRYCLYMAIIILFFQFNKLYLKSQNIHETQQHHF